jgi:hypothetical protein
MLKGLSKLSLKQIHDRIKLHTFDTKLAFNVESLEEASIPNSTREFLKKWNLPKYSNAMTLGGFTIYTKSSPKYGTVQWFPALAEWDWADECKLPFPVEIAQAIVFGKACGAKLGPNGSIIGDTEGNGSPICIKNDGSLVFYSEDENYREYIVNTDVEKLLFCIVFFQTMTALSRRKTKKNPFILNTVRPDYCDTIYEEMRAIDPKAIESPLSFWPLMLDLACFKHPLANGRRRYNVDK